MTEALDELYGLMDDVAADTRAGAAFDRARKIRDIRVSGARAATRTGAYDLPDTLVYVVNSPTTRASPCWAPSGRSNPSTY